jgi:hypothetical protein
MAYEIRIATPIYHWNTDAIIGTRYVNTGLIYATFQGAAALGMRVAEAKGLFCPEADAQACVWDTVGQCEVYHDPNAAPEIGCATDPANIPF